MPRGVLAALRWGGEDSGGYGFDGWSGHSASRPLYLKTSWYSSDMLQDDSRLRGSRARHSEGDESQLEAAGGAPGRAARVSEERRLHLSSFLAGTLHFHAPIDTAASNSTYTTSAEDSDVSSPFAASKALAPGSGYWCSVGKHGPKETVIWTGSTHRRRKVRAVKVSWAYAPGLVRVRNSPDGHHWDVVVPWHEPKDSGVSFQEDLIFDRPRNSLQIKIEMRKPREWGYYGINQASLELA
eukprot:TRINITY_DN110335_c0_g1_i1.p1 TRINITY_DN110335_c0_g1~~TRINITY_DN110335_c0_g1_i1.p1  ORF type:complete len:265 (+),score=17.47 TRINITY_DN110335_c0_g1_i1:78-797(+)